MKTLLLGCIAAALVTGAAGAADLPVRRAPPVYAPPIPAFSFTGLYIGGQVGYGFGRDNSFVNAGALVAGAAFPYGTAPRGVIGGGHAGYLFSTQSLPVFGTFLGGLGSGGVIGFEGDVDGVSGSRATDLGAFGGVPGFIFARERNDIQGSVRGRLGIAVNRVLFYATGGAAFADFQTTYDATSLGPFGTNQTFRRSRVGYTVGGGVEYALSNNISARIEYRYSDFGTYSDPTTFVLGLPVDVRHRETLQRVQAGLSYHFATPTPVVARY